MEDEYTITYINEGKSEILFKFNKKLYNKFIKATTKMEEMKQFYNCDELKIYPMDDFTTVKGDKFNGVKYSIFKNKNDKKPVFMFLWNIKKSTDRPAFYDLTKYIDDVDDNL